MKKIFLLAASALALTACDNTEENQPVSSKAIQVFASIGDREASRAFDSSWEDKDQIGISAIVGPLEKPLLQPHVNIPYSTTGTTKFTGKQIYFHNNMLLHAYYPFSGQEGTSPGIIKANTGAAYQVAGVQKNIDFLYDTQTGIKAADPTVNFAFSHKMSKVTITLVNGDNTVDVKNIVKYKIKGLVMQGSFDTTTGACLADKDVASEDFTITGLSNSVKSDQPLPSHIFFPQPTPQDVILEMYMDEVGGGSEIDYQCYSCSLKFGEGELKAGHHYNFKIFVTKKGLKVGEVSILDWTGGNTLSLIATIDGDAPFEEE